MGTLNPIPGGKMVRSIANVISRLFSVTPSGQVTPQQQAAQPTPIPFGGPAIYPDPNAINYIQLGFSGNAAVYTLIGNTARKFGSIPRYVYKIDDVKAWEEYKAYQKFGSKIKYKKLCKLEKKAYTESEVIDGADNGFSKILKRPNKNQGQDSFFELALVYYMTMGEAFIWLNRGPLIDRNGDPLDDAVADKKRPLEMYILPSQYINIIPDPYDVWGNLGYYFMVGGVQTFLRSTDVIHWKRPNPNFDAYSRQHLRGFSPLNPGNKILTENESGTDARVAMQQNDGAKGVLYQKNPAPLTIEQQSAIKGTVNSKINNRDMRSAVATLTGEWGYLNLGQTGKEMELVEAMKDNFTLLCNLFGVPPMLYQSNSTYQNIEQARKDLLTNLVLPLSASLRDEMCRVMVPGFGLDPNSYTYDVDTSSLSELQEDSNRYIQELAMAYWLTPNEKREAMNEERLDDPNMDIVLVPAGLVPIDEAVAEPPPMPMQIPPTNGLSNTSPNNNNSGQKNSDLPVPQLNGRNQ